jgi:hypothetical protein
MNGWLAAARAGEEGEMERLDSPPRARSRAIDAIVVLAIAILIALAIVEVLASHASAAEAEGSNVAAPWAPHVERVDEALAQDNVSAALRAWGNAYTAALGSRRWEGLIEVGDAYLRIGDRVAYRPAFAAKAREAYLAALFRARRQNSLDGVLRAADAFAALGDRQVVAQCLKLARELAGRDPQAQARVQGYTNRVSDPSITAGTLRIEP